MTKVILPSLGLDLPGYRADGETGRRDSLLPYAHVIEVLAELILERRSRSPRAAGPEREAVFCQGSLT